MRAALSRLSTAHWPQAFDNLQQASADVSIHWDRNRARPAVGEGFPFLLFRLQDGFTVPPWLTFPEAPL
jgi:hypothetical protein